MESIQTLLDFEAGALTYGRVPAKVYHHRTAQVDYLFELGRKYCEMHGFDPDLWERRSRERFRQIEEDTMARAARWWPLQGRA